MIFEFIAFEIPSVFLLHSVRFLLHLNVSATIIESKFEKKNIMDIVKGASNEIERETEKKIITTQPFLSVHQIYNYSWN